ncbi:hypothetical protein NIES4101_53500 [Calothrix sp. NIES-4101]|nr:hypothetical protein NIES4101_53500 [Calothrix sp. NIES-4101]
MPQELGCTGCIHYQGSGKCKAFPAKIPIPFASGELPHSQIALGQSGDFVFKKR